MKKKVSLLILFSILFSGCGKTDEPANLINNSSEKNIETFQSSTDTFNQNYYSYLDNIDRSTLVQTDISSCFMHDLSHPKTLKKLTSYLFLGLVTSIDKADILAENVTPDTYGTLKILTNIINNAPNTLTFIRSGGTIHEKELYKNMSQEEIAQQNIFREQDGLLPIEQSERWIEIREQNDIELQTGNIYLFFANYIDSMGLYDLEGYQYGAPLVEDNGQALKYSSSFPTNIQQTWQIKNLSTGEKTNLIDYLKKELDIHINENN